MFVRMVLRVRVALHVLAFPFGFTYCLRGKKVNELFESHSKGSCSLRMPHRPSMPSPAYMPYTRGECPPAVEQIVYPSKDNGPAALYEQVRARGTPRTSTLDGTDSLADDERAMQTHTRAAPTQAFPALVNRHLLAGRTAESGLWTARPSGGDPTHACCVLDAALRPAHAPVQMCSACARIVGPRARTRALANTSARNRAQVRLPAGGSGAAPGRLPRGGGGGGCGPHGGRRPRCPPCRSCVCADCKARAAMERRDERHACRDSVESKVVHNLLSETENPW